MSNLKIDIVSEYKGQKAFKQAGSSLEGLQKMAGKASLALAAAFSVQKIEQFAVDSVKAFMADEAAASKLAKVVDNLGLGFENANIADFIDKLTLATGVADDKLRPAFQALITTTGSVTNSQKLLQQALDISAGSGVDLEQVAQDLAQAYVGNTKGLKKYNLGLTNAELSASSFEEIMKKMNDQFGGSQAATLDTYAGKMQLLKNAAGEAQETIGKALMDAINHIAGGTDGVQKLADKFGKLATDVSNVIYALTKVYDTWKKLHDAVPSWMMTLSSAVTGVLKPLEALVKALEFLSKWGGDQKAKDTYVNATDQAGAIDYDAARKRAAAEAAALKRAKELARLQKEAAAKAAAEAKKAAQLKKASAIFDMQQIELVAALKGNLSKEDRNRAELQLALLTENTTEVTRLTKEIAKAQGLSTELTNYLLNLPQAQNPFVAWKGYLDEIELQAKRIAAFSAAGTPAQYSGIATNYTPTAKDLVSSGAASVGFGSNGNIVVNVNGSVISQNDLVDAIQIGLQNRSLSGSPSTIGRLYGMFGG